MSARRAIVGLALLGAPACLNTARDSDASSASRPEHSSSTCARVVGAVPATSAESKGESPQAKSGATAVEGNPEGATLTPEARPPSADAWLERKASFKPPGDPYPQIVQGHDYGTIKAIEFFYNLLLRLHGGSAQWALTENAPSVVTVEVQGSKLELRGNDLAVEVVVFDDFVGFNDREQEAPETVALFKTLHRVLASLSTDFTLVGLKGAQYGSRAYRRITTLEFAAGDVVVELVALSNGENSEERLYVLDVARRSESHLWRPTSAAQ